MRDDTKYMSLYRDPSVAIWAGAWNRYKEASKAGAVKSMKVAIADMIHADRVFTLELFQRRTDANLEAHASFFQ